MPVDDLRDRLEELRDGREARVPVVIYCRIGYWSYLAARMLAQRGWPNVFNLAGGYLSWRAEQDAASPSS